ncbi:MAG TPA: EAL domain-containing protein [Sphingomicrobium sp.]|nr:EAL domain-containing protein [Sphingomicrobium sp.]
MPSGAHHNLTRAHGHRSVFSKTIIVALGATIVAAFFLAGIGIYWATHQSDAVSVERQARSARHVMESSVDELALQQETVAIWDDSITQIVADELDMTWIHDNIGSWLHRIFSHDEVFIVDGYDRPIYAAVGGEQAPVARYATLSADLGPLLHSLRSRDGGSNGRHDRRPGRMVHPDSAVRTTPRATHESHIILVGGRPAAASAMLIQPSTPDYAKPKGDWPVLVSVRYVDAGFLAELSSRQLIASPRFSRRPERQPEEHAIGLQTEWGSLIGYLLWKPELPGTRILWKLVPINLLILVGLASFMVFLGRRLRGAAAELGAAEAQSHHLAFHDSLTGLPNRALFQLQLDRLTSGPGSSNRFALLLLDVDEFKLTNDTLGHDAGDALLRVFADRLKNSIRSDDLVARLGGDEFALLLMGMSGAAEIKAFAAILLERLGEPVEHDGKPIHSRASIGASRTDGFGAEHMLKHADLALYEAKASGRGAFRLYNPAMRSRMQQRGEMLAMAAAALDGDFVKPFYQPKIDLKTGAIVGFEALLRCCMPGNEPKAAGCIAAAFEDSTLAVKLSDRMVDGVIRDILAWQASGLTFGHVAINAALAELRRGDFAERLLGKLRTAGIAPERIQVEVTESVLLGQAIDHVERTFSELAEAGIKLALDDFGTGFASLTHLKRFPVEIIKIDQSFIRDLQIDAEDGAIVDAVVGLGRALKIEVVAEGIETVMQRDFLSALGCAVGQGYLFGSALPAARISELLREDVKSPKRAAA